GLEPCQHGQHETRSLAGAGLGDAEHVAPGDGHRDGLGLDGGRIGVAGRSDSSLNFRAEPELSKGGRFQKEDSPSLVKVAGTPQALLQGACWPTSESAGGLGDKGPNGKDWKGETRYGSVSPAPVTPATWHRLRGIARKRLSVGGKMSRRAKIASL